MKTILLTALALGSISFASAANLNMDSFGDALAGWDKKGESCNYLLNDGTYRTLRPTVTKTSGGGIFVSVIVEFDPRGGVDATGWLEMSFDSSGRLKSAQAKARMVGQYVDTGAIKPTAETVEGADKPRVQSADDVMIDLFNRLDQKLVDSRAKIEEKRDNSVMSRMKYKKFKRLNMSAALRHNANALLRSVK